LFVHVAAGYPAAFAPRAGFEHSGMLGVLTHDEAGPGIAPALHDDARTEVAVGDPHLTELRCSQQRLDDDTFLGVRVLAGQHVGDQAAVRVVDHQAVARQGRSAELAQRLEPLVHHPPRRNRRFQQRPRHRAEGEGLFELFQQFDAGRKTFRRRQEITS
jgi:hypothetical protein